MFNSATKSTIQSILRDNLPSTHRAFIFGSRSTDSHRKYSDIDLGITGSTPLDSTTFFTIESALEDSDLPYRVDLVDFARVSPRFRTIAMQNTLYL
jgi:predicted nucleotidyltransferase